MSDTNTIRLVRKKPHIRKYKGVWTISRGFIVVTDESLERAWKNYCYYYCLL